MRCLFICKIITSGIRTGGQTAHKNSMYIAVVVDSIVSCHTAQACRKAVALVRGNPVISTKWYPTEPVNKVWLGAFLYF